MGEERFEMGDAHHGTDDSPEGDGHEEVHGHPSEPHEMPWFPMNLPLVVLAIGALLAGVIFYESMEGWIAGSTANPVGAEIVVKHAGEAAAHAEGHDDPHHAKWLGGDVHTMMALVSGALAIAGIGLAAFFFWLKRDVTETVASMFGVLRTAMRRKWWVDELYDAAIVRPLGFLSDMLRAIDELAVSGLLLLVGHLPGFIGLGVRPAQNGKLQSYGLAMVLGLGVLAVVVMVLAR
jgi:NADH-quinone oxidoreductase subunit L